MSSSSDKESCSHDRDQPIHEIHARTTYCCDSRVTRNSCLRRRGASAGCCAGRSGLGPNLASLSWASDGYCPADKAFPKAAGDPFSVFLCRCFEQFDPQVRGRQVCRLDRLLNERVFKAVIYGLSVPRAEHRDVPTVRRARGDVCFAWGRSAASQGKGQKAQTQPMTRPALHLQPLSRNFQPDHTLTRSSRNFVCGTLCPSGRSGASRVSSKPPVELIESRRDVVQPTSRFCMCRDPTIFLLFPCCQAVS